MILLKLLFSDGANCKNSLKWSTIINFSCSYESELIHVSTNFTSCTYIFQWETREACESLVTVNLAYSLFKKFFNNHFFLSLKEKVIVWLHILSILILSIT